jgi:hypothetical protein
MAEMVSELELTQLALGAVVAVLMPLALMRHPVPVATVEQVNRHP